jgi:hypothetical protein
VRCASVRKCRHDRAQSPFEHVSGVTRRAGALDVVSAYLPAMP